ncbi:hypothetical protein [Sinorhizobium saheli]|uniref:Uncharacterized protein n=1 Tax=Sinorhizobium saheli TaxID=36856 RepID=A0A178YPY4_SINSA|nr:hypothetical protein [Sinorhizobium saheli]MQW86925.1 hypothetical protein [Sinorhizobium saheli]OAP49296.1 hypothetical protein ATB98_24940 [Sinorhizobium saheli]
MYNRNRYGQPERKASAGAPLAIALLAMLAIAAYLLVGGALLDNRGRDVAVYLPPAANVNSAVQAETAQRP